MLLPPVCPSLSNRPNCNYRNVLFCPSQIHKLNHRYAVNVAAAAASAATPTHRNSPLSLLVSNASSSSLANGAAEQHSLQNPNPSPGPLRHVCVSESEGGDGSMVSSASAVAAAIRRASTSPVEFVQTIEKEGKSKGLVLPSSDFQRLCLEQMDLFRRIVHPDALLSVIFASEMRH